MDQDFAEDLVFGKMGESLAEVILSEENEVFRFGYENTLQKFSPKRGEIIHDDTSNMVRVMPDFVVYNKMQKKVTFVEIKTTRKNQGLEKQVDNSRNLHHRNFYKHRDYQKFYPDCIFMQIVWNSTPKITFLKSVKNDKKNEQPIRFTEVSFEELPFTFTWTEEEKMLKIIKENIQKSLSH